VRLVLIDANAMDLLDLTKLATKIESLSPQRDMTDRAKDINTTLSAPIPTYFSSLDLPRRDASTCPAGQYLVAPLYLLRGR
jgi:hypothetical protein